MGLLDTIKIGRESSKPQPSLLRSTQTLRHALALNETRHSFQPYLIGPLSPSSPELAHHSIIEAWFMGSHADMGGGSREDGLSLYPLQWMLLESRTFGLLLEPSWGSQTLTEDPLGLVFPLVPDEDPSKHPKPLAPWIFSYKNGIEIEMVDIRSSHRHGNLQAGKKKVMLRRATHTTRRKHVDDNMSVQSYPLSHTTSGQSHKPSWRERFRLGKKTSKATLAPARSRKDTEVDSLWTAPSLRDELVEVGPRPHEVQINSGPALFSLFSAPRQVFDSHGLVGYLESSKSLIS